MKRLLLACVCTLIPISARAQTAVNEYNTVVAACGNQSYTAGNVKQVTQDTTGSRCIAGTITPSGTQDVNLKQVGGATVTLGQGTKSQSLPVTLPSDQTVVVTEVPATSGGASMYSGNITTAGSGAGTGGVAIDASPGQLYGWAIYNANSSVCYIQIFDQTQALTNLGTTVPKIAFGIPANGGANVWLTVGLPFATAITAGVTTTRAGSTACSTGLDINLWYK